MILNYVHHSKFNSSSVLLCPLLVPLVTLHSPLMNSLHESSTRSRLLQVQHVRSSWYWRRRERRIMARFSVLEMISSAASQHTRLNTTVQPTRWKRLVMTDQPDPVLISPSRDLTLMWLPSIYLTHVLTRQWTLVCMSETSVPFPVNS